MGEAGIKLVGVGLDHLSSGLASLGAADTTRRTAKRNVVGAGVEIGLGIKAGHAAGHGIRKAASDEMYRLLSGRHFVCFSYDTSVCCDLAISALLLQQQLHNSKSSWGSVCLLTCRLCTARYV